MVGGMAMYCTECGTRSAGGKFCGTCGTPVAESARSIRVSSWSPPGSGPALSSNGTPPAPGSFGGQPAGFGPPAGPAGHQPVGQPAWPVPSATGLRPPTARFAWDYGRDVGAAVLLIWSLTLPWRGATGASAVVYVLLTTLLALSSLAVVPLSRALRAPDGSALRWPTLWIRASLCGPYAVVALIAVIRELVGSGPDLGASLLIGVLGAAIALVPRELELAGMNAPLVAHRFRVACGVCGGLGIAAMAVSTLVAVPPSQWFGTGSMFFLAIVPILILVALFAFIFGVTAIRVAMGHPAWQPTLVWIGVAMAVLVVVDAGDSAESSRDAFYGLWLFMLSAGLAATPMIGGRDGARTEARLWALVVANAFRLILIGASSVLVVFILVLIQAGQYGGTPSGEFVWTLVSTVGTIVAAAVGSSQLRADPRRGRPIALICVGAMVLLRVVDLSVAGWSSSVGNGSASTIALLAGTYGVIAFALLVPAPMRQLVGLPPPAAGSAGPGDQGSAVQGLAGSAMAGTDSTPAAGEPFPAQAPLPEAGGVTPAHAWNGDLATTVMITNNRSAFANHQGPSPVEPPCAEPGEGPDPQARSAADPTTTGQDLMSIAAGRPDLRPAVAANPSTYPALLDWLRALGDPNVDAALAARQRQG